MVDIEEEILNFIAKYSGTPLFCRKQTLPIETDIDTDLHLEKEEAEELMNIFFDKFNVNPLKFNINIYYPEEDFHFIADLLAILIPSKRPKPTLVPDFTIRMLIESAKAGYWLYD
ncbi:DUF1493 family protein [Xenorhabdus anantnagensis]|uniref:DUF1493 family protein n=1 Tax=Xenorhabdus anantnagensis TaxID=3025875 RepID=A0ABT5LV84_9GAMM|nr:DUF1493 family protein [Xenorhabdus anantnagensis]MDC9598336.1 DUF1493 family protein [Xenorhabdus anantnagensis]